MADSTSSGSLHEASLNQGRIYVEGFESAVGYDPTEDEREADDISEEAILAVSRRVPRLRARTNDEREQTSRQILELHAAARSGQVIRDLQVEADDVELFVQPLEDDASPRAVASLRPTGYSVVLEIVNEPAPVQTKPAKLDQLLGTINGNQAERVLESEGHLIVGYRRENGKRRPHARLVLELSEVVVSPVDET